MFIDKSPTARTLLHNPRKEMIFRSIKEPIEIRFPQNMPVVLLGENNSEKSQLGIGGIRSNVMNLDRAARPLAQVF
jgi:hypothetical protein